MNLPFDHAAERAFHRLNELLLTRPGNEMPATDLTRFRFLEHIWYMGKAAGWHDGREVALIGTPADILHWLDAYLLTREQRAAYSARESAPYL